MSDFGLKVVLRIAVRASVRYCLWMLTALVFSIGVWGFCIVVTAQNCSVGGSPSARVGGGPGAFVLLPIVLISLIADWTRSCPIQPMVTVVLLFLFPIFYHVLILKHVIWKAIHTLLFDQAESFRIYLDGILKSVAGEFQSRLTEEKMLGSKLKNVFEKIPNAPIPIRIAFKVLVRQMGLISLLVSEAKMLPGGRESEWITNALTKAQANLSKQTRPSRKPIWILGLSELAIAVLCFALR